VATKPFSVVTVFGFFVVTVGKKKTMKNVKWTDNVCTVGGTCIHGYFNGADLTKLWQLCPSGHATPTFCHERLGPRGFGIELLDVLKSIKYFSSDNDVLYNKEYGYYFTFMEKDGDALLSYLSGIFTMKKGENGY